MSAPADVIKLIQQGERVRSVARTDMNEVSSRSHSLLTITVTAKLQDGSIRVGKLNLADLAGSERADKSGLIGSNLSEAKKINQSLSALGNCINALTDSKRSHVPFRDSRLTYILKDSLGGNTKTSLLVTCSPHAANSDETLSTLYFAQRAQHVRNQVRVNRQLGVTELQALVDTLRKQLADSRATIKQMQRDARMGRTPTAAADDFDDDENGATDSYQSNTLPRRSPSSVALHSDQSPADAKNPFQHDMHARTLPARPFADQAKFYATAHDAQAYHASTMEFPAANNPSAFDVNNPHGNAVASTLPRNYMSNAVRQQMGNMYGSVRSVNSSQSSNSINNNNNNNMMMMNGRQPAPLEEQWAQFNPATVIDRAKEAMRKSLASKALDPLDAEEVDADILGANDAMSAMDLQSNGNSVSGDDANDMERRVAKQKLQDDLRAAKKRRDMIRSAQRRQADTWAAQRLENALDSGNNSSSNNNKHNNNSNNNNNNSSSSSNKSGGFRDDDAVRRLMQEEEQVRALEEALEMQLEADHTLRELEEANVRNTGRRDNDKYDNGKQQRRDLKIVTGHDIAPPGDADDWSPVSSPIPPPPEYPYPPSNDDSTIPSHMNSHSSTLPARLDSNNNNNNNSSNNHNNTKDDLALTANNTQVSASVLRPHRAGAHEYRVDLFPDPDAGPDQPIIHLGFLEVKSTEVLLDEIRQRIHQELDDVPENFIFLRKRVPIGVRQEKKRPISYVVSSDDVISIRVDNSNRGGVETSIIE